MKPQIIRVGAFDIQVCVPAGWLDKDIILFAEHQYPCGTDQGWIIRKEGDEALGGDPERNPCNERPGFIHVVLDA